MNKPAFGKTTERHDRPDGVTEIVERHYHKNQEVLNVFSQEESIMVEDESQAYAVLAHSLKNLTAGKATKVELAVFTDPKTGELQRITQRYEVGRVRR